ncbi:Protein of unknown function [Amycolatopsis saalfeldensis]|uniref:DUF3558 domain-containing protein n=2 Tax=Amycolatopsis saalfeldensis TaxID=394193 RepID=A0A1H8YJQ1_9PSEU|nr:Protein of unknown function [Amycolatopsis saalfeldensis]
MTMTACSGGNTPGTPNPTGSESSSAGSPSGTSSALPYAGAPKVANPLPASVLSGDPCTDALTPQQVTGALGSPVKTKQDTIGGFGPFCSWTNTDTTSSAKITVAYDTTTHQGLSGAYQNSKPQSTIWQEMSIEGFPAVAHASAHNSCQIFVGLADDVMIDVGGFLSLSKIDQVDPCQSTQKAASAVVTTLKQKAGA